MENEQRGMITFILAVCGNVDYVYSFPQSPPSRAAWIEIPHLKRQYLSLFSRRLHGRRGLKSVQSGAKIELIMSPPSRAAWIEILPLMFVVRIAASPPSRAAWIEIPDEGYGKSLYVVAAFTGGVD